MRHYRYAHRGLYDPDRGVPENSLPAFVRAIEHGFGSELDVRLLADKSLAVFHDSDLRRMTGQPGRVEQLTAEALRNYSLAGTRETIPELRDVLELYSVVKLPLLIELKPEDGNHEALSARVAEELDRARTPCLVESFDPRCLAWFHKHRPNVLRGQLAEDPRRVACPPADRKRRFAHELAGAAISRRAQPDFFAFRFDHRDSMTWRVFTALCRPEVFYWTIRTPGELAAAEAEGAQVIFEGFIP